MLTKSIINIYADLLLTLKDELHHSNNHGPDGHINMYANVHIRISSIELEAFTNSVGIKRSQYGLGSSAVLENYLDVLL